MKYKTIVVGELNGVKIYDVVQAEPTVISKLSIEKLLSSSTGNPTLAL